MIDTQVLLNGLVLGALYACIAVGFSLVWGVLNIINLLLLFSAVWAMVFKP